MGKMVPSTTSLAHRIRSVSGSFDKSRVLSTTTGVPTPGAWGSVPSAACWEPVSTARVSSWQASEASSATSHCSHYLLNHPHHPQPHPWKICLPRNQTPGHKRLGTAAIQYTGPWLCAYRKSHASVLSEENGGHTAALNACCMLFHS